MKLFRYILHYVAIVSRVLASGPSPIQSVLLDFYYSQFRNLFWKGKG